ncbi:MAG: AAA family ATPase [Magnetococcales bacterium]|nr:AAA family ATPase [Magnetococcales bacterium]
MVQKLRYEVATRKGHFVAGKFISLQTSTPLLAIQEAVEEYIHQIQQAHPEQLIILGEQLSQKLGDAAPLIREAFPALKDTLNHKPYPIERPPQESHNRFVLAFVRFLEVITQTDGPFILFLDDLQWADSLSLDLLYEMVINPSLSKLTILGTYRDNELFAEDPLQNTLDKIADAKVDVCFVPLVNLDEYGVKALLRDTLNRAEDSLEELTKACVQKTGGNPMFMHGFLFNMAERGAIRIGTDGWQWNIKAIAAEPVSDNLAGVIEENLALLPPKTLDLLGWGASIGNRFNGNDISKLAKLPLETIQAQLQPALEKEVILQPWVDPIPSQQTNSTDIEYLFTHDQLHKTAYESMRPKQRKTRHEHIAKLFLDKLDTTHQDPNIFKAVWHLNQSITPKQPMLLKERIEWNVKAGRQAMESTAFESANHFFKTALKLLDKEAFKQDYSLAFNLHYQNALIAYLLADSKRMNKLIAKAQPHVHGDIDQVALMELEILVELGQGNLAKGAQLGIVALKKLGICVKKAEEEGVIQQEILNIRKILSPARIPAILSAKPMVDQHALTIARLVVLLSASLYNTAPASGIYAFFKHAQLITEKGRSPFYLHVLGGYSFFLCGPFGEPARGLKIGELVLDHVRAEATEQVRYLGLRGRALYYLGLGVFHWRYHWRKSRELLQESWGMCQQEGDMEYGSYARCMSTIAEPFWGSQTIADLFIDAKSLSEEFRLLKKDLPVIWMNITAQALNNIIQPGKESVEIKGTYFDEETQIAAFFKTNNTATINAYHLYKIMLAYLFSDFKLADEIARKGEATYALFTGLATQPVFLIFSVLARLEVLNSRTESQRQEDIVWLIAQRKTIKGWKKLCPLNYEHRYHLVEAEWFKVNRQNTKAGFHYEAAIAGAQENDFALDTALSQELAGRFYQETGRPTLSRRKVSDGVKSYRQWGAEAKAQMLEKQFHLINKKNQFSSQTDDPKIGIDAGIDLHAVLQASWAIAKEIKWDSLVAKLMEIILENTGAQRGCLVGIINNTFQLKAEGFAGEQVIPAKEITMEKTIDYKSKFSSHIVRWVLHNNKEVVLDNAAQDSPFANTEYVRSHKTCSVLCIPLQLPGDEKGIIYLENDLAAGIFTPARVETARLLASQAAISLSNSHLLEIKEQLEKTRLEQRLQEQESRLLEQARDTAQRADHSKGRFLRAASHDLRQPVSAMKLFLPQLQPNSAASSKAKEAYNGLLTCVTNMREMFDTLQEASQIHSGKIVPSLQLTPIKDIFSRVVEEFLAPATDKGIRLNFVATSLSVQTDPVLLHRILRNLIANAINYTHQGRVLLGVRHLNGMVRVEVWDTGIGIAQELVAYLEEEFYQVPDISGRKGDGLGLGLTIAGGMVKLLGSRLSIRSEQDRGSCFSFVLPLSSEQNIKQNPIRENFLSSDKPIKIAVLSSNKKLHSEINSLLVQWEYDLWVRESLDVNHKNNQQTPDIIVMVVEEKRPLAFDWVKQLPNKCPIVVLYSNPELLKKVTNNLEIETHSLSLPVKPTQLSSLLHRLT